MVKIRKLCRGLAAGAVVVTLTACDDLLTVQDPSRFTDDDVDLALAAVAAGIEGRLHGAMDSHIRVTAMLADVFQHTGTWIGYDDTDHGRVDWERNTYSGSSWLSLRFEANDAIGRFDRVEAEGGTVPVALRAQVLVSEGWMDLFSAMGQCEAPQGQGTGAITDMQMFAQARDKLTAVLSIATGDFELWARAGIARAELMLGNYGPADVAAAAVLAASPNYEKLALFQISTQENSIVVVNTWGFNHTAGIREKWWPLVDDATRMMRDPLTNELDPRIPIRHEAGVLGRDGTTEFYSQWKYTLEGSDIPITHADEMVLIRAEAAMETGSPAGALAMLNGLRNAAGLLDAPASMFADPANPTRDEVFNVLINERFAELFMEGSRLQDLHRFGLTRDMMLAGDFVETESIRPTKFPMSQSEAIENPNIEDSSSARCLPTVST